MLKYIIKRLLLLIPILIGITLIVQILISLTPGDPAKMMLGARATPENVAALREEMGLDDPFWVRYGRYMWGLMHGDFGTSYNTKRTVINEVLQRFPYTLKLVCISMLITIALGIPLGVFAATNQNTWKDNLAMFISLFFVSMPAFWFALMLVRTFAVQHRWLPLNGIETWKGWILPSVSLALSLMSSVARQTRSSMLEVIRQDYIITARAKGLSEGKVIYRHALKNALVPVIMVIGGMFGTLLGGALISEVIFSVPGMGSYTMDALNNRDYPVIQSSVLILSALFSIVILIVDVIFALVDPRIRSQYIKKKSRKAVKENAAEA